MYGEPEGTCWKGVAFREEGLAKREAAMVNGTRQGTGLEPSGETQSPAAALGTRGKGAVSSFLPEVKFP